MVDEKTLYFTLGMIGIVVLIGLFKHHVSSLLILIQKGGWYASLLFLVFYCLATVLCLPTMILTLASGAIFGMVAGTLLNLTGATLGALCAFVISRYWMKPKLSCKNILMIKKLAYGVEKRGWQFVALVRLIPFLPFNLVNYGLAFTRINTLPYILTTFIFLLPAEIIYTYCGYTGRGMIANMQFSPYHFLAFFGIVLIIPLTKGIYYRIKTPDK